MIAFWVHDKFPYLLGGKVTKQTDQYVETEEFGPGFRFTALYLLEDEQGMALKERLQELEATRRAKLRAVDTQCDNLLRKVMDEFKL